VQRLAGKDPNAMRELGPVRPLCYCTHIHYGRIASAYAHALRICQ
jgi:hypothetical protein